MKNCKDYIPALSAFIDGELSEQERDDVLAHLDGCEACRAYLAQLAAMRESLGEELTPPEGFAAGVMERLHEAAAPRKRTHRTRWLGLAACAAVVALVGAIALPQMTEHAASTDGAAAPEASMAKSANAEEEYLDEASTIHYGIEAAGEYEAKMSENGMTDGDGAAQDQMLFDSGFAGAQEEHAVFYALSAEAETYLAGRGMELYEQTEDVCSYLAPVETAREMAELGLLTETGEELTPLADIAEGSVIVVVRMSEAALGEGEVTP